MKTPEERRAEFAAMDRWLLEHPTQATVWALGLAILIFELAMFLRLGLEALARG